MAEKLYSKGEECVVVYHSFDPSVDVYIDDGQGKENTLLSDLYKAYLQEEIDNHSDINENECYIDENEGWAQITWEDGDRTTFVQTTITYRRKEDCYE